MIPSPLYSREVAACVSPAGRELAPSVPWQQIVGMRHRLVHTYFAINSDLVWEVIDADLKPLIAALRGATDPPPDSPTHTPQRPDGVDE